jgi:hypothetical protein
MDFDFRRKLVLDYPVRHALFTHRHDLTNHLRPHAQSTQSNKLSCNLKARSRVATTQSLKKPAERYAPASLV